MSSVAKNVRPMHNPLLWAQILPSARRDSLKPPRVDNGTNPSNIQNIPIVPENKNHASLRMILHDTKSTLEQFSDRIGNLVSGIDQSKREIDTVTKMFAEVNEKLLDEVNAIANRSQKVLLETLDSPAQASALDQLRIAQMTSDRKLESLENKTDLMQKQLQAISEQQGQILASLASVTPLAPLLKDSPNQQNQIISSLGTLLPLLQVLQTLPAHLKAIQQEAVEKLTASIDSMHSASSSPPPTAAAQGAHYSADPQAAIDQRQVLKRKHSMQASSEKDQQSFSACIPNSTPRRDAILPSDSDKTLSSDNSPLVMKTNQGMAPSASSESSTAGLRLSLPPSSHRARSPMHPNLANPLPDDNGNPKRQRLEPPSVRDPPRQDEITAAPNILAKNPPASSDRTLGSETSQARPADASKAALPRRKPQPQYSGHLPASSDSRGFRLPAPPGHGSGPASSIPTPHAPGAFVQCHSTGPHRLLSATSHALRHTPSPPARIVMKKQSANGRTLISQLPPSTPPFERDRPAVYEVPSSGARGGGMSLSNLDVETTEPNPGPLRDLQVYASSSELPVRKQPRRTRQRMLLDDTLDIDGTSGREN